MEERESGSVNKFYSGTGHFENGQLHEQALIIEKNGWRLSLNYEHGVINGFRKSYYRDGKKMKELDISGWASSRG